MRNSFRLMTVAGIPVEINISWFIILGLVVMSLSNFYFPSQVPGLSGGAYLLIGIATSLLLFASLLLHELSHSIVAIRNGLPIHGITLFVFGGIAHMEKEPQSPVVELKMAAAGPLMSVSLALLFLVISALSARAGHYPVITVMSGYLAFLNAAVAVFNMIPGFPLDGGRVFRAAIWHFTKDLKKATLISSSIGKLLAFTLMGLGLAGLISGYIISGFWFIFIGFFLLEAADVGYKQVALKKAFTGLRINDLMTRAVISVPSGMHVRDLFDNYFLKYRHNCFPVMKDDEITGVITFHDAKETPRGEWDTRTASEIQIPLGRDLTADKEMPVMDAMAKMAHNGIGRLLVIDAGKLAGIISQRDIMKLFRLKEEVDRP